MPADITPLILTFDEAPNLRRTLERLTWVREILIVDSFSSDETLEIARSFPQVRVVQRKFDTFAGQCNFGLDQVRTEWVLSLDADYVLTEELVAELKGLRDDGLPPQNSELGTLNPTLQHSNTPAAAERRTEDEVVGYRARFRYCIHGRPLRASLYPPRTVLYRRARARYRDEGHGHRVAVDGPVRDLAGLILHDDRKPLDRWLREQDGYARKEAAWLVGDRREEMVERREKKEEGQAQNPSSVLCPPFSAHRSPSSALPPPLSPLPPRSLPDRIRRKIVLAPPLVFFYTLFCKGLILDGWPGWYYVFQRTLAEVLLSLRLIEQKLKH